MATCPHCKGHLTDGHRCPRRPSIVAIEIIASILFGGFGGLMLLAVFDPNGQAPMDGLAFVIGALAGFGINRFLRS